MIRHVPNCLTKLKEPDEENVDEGIRACVDLSPEVFLARLAALVPPPYWNVARDYGVLADRRHLRDKVLPSYRSAQPRQLTLFERRGGMDPLAGTR